jgi:hypothetical protein
MTTEAQQQQQQQQQEHMYGLAVDDQASTAGPWLNRN